MKRFSALGLGLICLAIQAQDVPPLYQGADLATGPAAHRRAQMQCLPPEKGRGRRQRHLPTHRRISTLAALRGMVEQCNTELNLGLFPEETNSVAAVLNRDHYRHTR
jgi:hypothetical protein